MPCDWTSSFAFTFFITAHQAHAVTIIVASSPSSARGFRIAQMHRWVWMRPPPLATVTPLALKLYSADLTSLLRHRHAPCVPAARSHNESPFTSVVHPSH